ncbi:PH domain-containing protein [Haploplasma axanthum]|uniref:Bacterial membrane flanked domain n=1 Tax=Haploplasma axanthum TaxID=29552 RepID=A0A449BF07_HAPAX|nr:PH domain-containing protein [Haploplasma axanthum]VEU81043.1 Bacterial membrane flanked domain [Haploplasma axanthum]
MNNNKYHIAKKSYISVIVTGILSIAISIFGLIVIVFGDENEKLVITSGLPLTLIIIGGVVLLILFLIISWILVNKHVFYDNNDNFIIEKGWLFKRKIAIPYDKIHSIGLKRNIIDLMLGTTKVEFDTGTTVATGSEGRLPLDKDYALVLKEFLEKKKDNPNLVLPSPIDKFETINSEKEVFYRATNKNLLKMGILRQPYLITVMIMIFYFLIIMYPIIISDKSNDSTTVFGLLIAMIVAIIVLTIFFAVYSLIVYYRYELNIDGDSLEYQYGLISKTNYKINKKRINAVHLKQSFLYRLFKKYSLEVSVLGIGDARDNNDNKSSTESKYLMPYANLEEVTSILKYLGYEEVLDNEFIKPKKYRLLNYVVIPGIFISLLHFLPLIFLLDKIAIVYLPTVITGIISYFFCITLLFLRLKNKGYNIKNKFISRTGALSIKTTIINKSKIQSLNFYQSPIYLIERLGIINVKYKELFGTIRLQGYEIEEFEKLKKDIFDFK